ncbi:MAG: hypothetical protein SWH54_03845 [Thermodesulfobacteriota bacterium]|nr:hypothetical protein [Thermodesulfobacteriota bacterium]
MLGLERSIKFYSAIIILLVVFFSGQAIAAMVSLSSGKKLDLTSRQVELLKEQQGIYFFHYPPRRIISGNLQYWVFIEIPQEFGGGFLIGKPDKVTAAINAVSNEKEAVETDPFVVQTRKAGSWFQSEFLLSTGYRVDDLDWNIAGDINGNNPNILSELTWNNLESFQLKMANKTSFQQRLMLRGSLDYSWIFDGENQDSDYFGDNRTLEFSRSNNNSDEGNMLDASFGVGWQFTFGRSDFVMAPVIGYSYHEQNLTITDGFQTIPPSGPFPGLDSTYETEWKGPWIGVDLTFRTDEKSNITPEIETVISLEYHWADYYAEADWNLRADFEHPKSFEHEADAQGIIFSAIIKFLLDDHWGVNVNLDYQDWSTDEGTIRFFNADGTRPIQRLNEVNWSSYAIMAGIVYQF